MRILSLLVLMIALIACTNNKFDIKVAEKVNPKIIRFDELLFEKNPDSVVMEIPKLIKTYPKFSSLYFNKVIKIGDPSQSKFYDGLTLFLSNYDYRMSYVASQKLFKNFDNYKALLVDALSRYKHYFPNKTCPNIYLMISGFSEAIAVSDNTLAFSVDRFLGKDSHFYEQLRTPKYLRKRMEPNLMVSEGVRGWIASEFPFNDSLNTLVSKMVYYGTILYTMDALFPNLPDNKKIGFTDNELLWCKNSEKSVWSYFMDKKLLFSNNRLMIKKFISPAPFSGPFTKNSPGRVGQWVGWQIVREYMNRHPNVTLQQLMNNHSYHKILVQSKYHP